MAKKQKANKSYATREHIKANKKAKNQEAVDMVAKKDIKISANCTADIKANSNQRRRVARKVNVKGGVGISEVRGTLAFLEVKGGVAAATQALAAQPTSDVKVTVARTDGGTDLSVTDRAMPTLAGVNWNKSQLVAIGAAEDADAPNGTATITVVSTGLTSQMVTANEVDNDTQGLVRSVTTVAVNKGTAPALKWQDYCVRSGSVGLGRRHPGLPGF